MRFRTPVLLVMLLTLTAVWAGENPALERLRKEFLKPPRQYAQYPLWFWNDELTEEGIRRQIGWMDEKGVFGFTIHPRMGLSKKVGYLTPRWLELTRIAVEEAARRQMYVYLYDEGMYPSGSAHGKVVEGHPELASQGLQMTSVPFTGPGRLTHNVQLGERESLVALVLLKRDSGSAKYLPETARLLPAGREIREDLPAGDWTLFSFVQMPSGGQIRGVHPEEEEKLPGAPPSADILNPAATARFIAETHEKYYAVLAPHFGRTVLGIFTDEPGIMGRRGKRGLMPWTEGFLRTLNKSVQYDFTSCLPFLWVEAADGRELTLRHDYRAAVAEALNQNYYRPLSEWCANHGIALTGHPSGGGDMKPQVYFQEPGQDIVWRGLLPGKATRLEGGSVVGKSASSMAVNLGRPVVLNELYGAYGWRLTMDEMKWLADWLFVRGTNRLVPHAFYYSVEGDRIFERPPDLSWFNVWWPHYGDFATYTNRLSWTMTGGAPVAPVGIVTVSGNTPWRASSALLRNQRDFHYIDDSLFDRAEFKQGQLQLAEAIYTVLVLDGLNLVEPELLGHLEQCLKSGITVLSWESALTVSKLRPDQGSQSAVARLKAHPLFKTIRDERDLLAQVSSAAPWDLRVSPAAPELRYAHRVRDGVDFYLLVNEGDTRISALASFRQVSMPEFWDAETGRMWAPPVIRSGREETSLRVELEPRQSLLAVFGHGSISPASRARSFLTERTLVLPDDGWTLRITGRELPGQALDDWTRIPEMADFSGTAWYERRVSLPARFLDDAEEVLLDCGTVREWALVEINGISCGARLWLPFVFDIKKALRPGENRVRIGVTNTRANELEHLELTSGLFGPVRIVAH